MRWNQISLTRYPTRCPIRDGLEALEVTFGGTPVQEDIGPIIRRKNTYTLNMSQSKRTWANIGTVTISSEVASVKRRAVSRCSISSILNDASDDNESDQDMTSITTESTSAALGEVCNLPSTSTSPWRSTSPASAQLGYVSRKIGEQRPSKRGICFGMVGSTSRSHFEP